MKTIDPQLRQETNLDWLSKDSIVTLTICPDLAERAKIEEWNPQELIRRAIPRFSPWIQRIFGTDDHISEATSQNLILSFMESRLDLRFDPSMGTPTDYVIGITRNVLKATRREECDRHLRRLIFDTADMRPHDISRARARERKLRLAIRLIGQRTVKQRQALSEKYKTKAPKSKKMVSRQAKYLARHHAIRTIRKEVMDFGLMSSFQPVPKHRRRRYYRFRRKRVSPPPTPSQDLRDGSRHDKIRQEELLTAIMIKQPEIDVRNMHVLKELFDGLPNSCEDRIDVMAQFKKLFEYEFAKRVESGPSMREPSNSGEPSPS